MTNQHTPGMKSVKWTMHNRHNFTGELDGYSIVVQPGGIGWYWEIFKGGISMDNCYKYCPTQDELSAKVQAERSLNKIISNE